MFPPDGLFDNRQRESNASKLYKFRDFMAGNRQLMKDDLQGCQVCTTMIV
ncbi:hypothetical protein SAMN05660895_1559 [Thermoflavifilum thermophilum]|uniref:Uncharacterized protein n=1 Tax=Thermoflavifilum thermophilum TaxID=1393122 RepID=A0A1I7NEY2_9BACT|nr:hypothetical protein SAMN05660895_1559 [Thermoflavifilum thermophilum]